MKKSAILNSFRGLLIFSLLIPFAPGCTPKKGGSISDTTAMSPSRSSFTSMSSSDSARTAEKFDFSWDFDGADSMDAAPEDVLKKAFAALGTPYVRGGNTPREGFDCSGFVCWAYKDTGIALPRTAREQSVVGQPIKNSEDMQVGDIVAFWHPKRGYHTGIYVGDEKFIHSPRRRQVVRVNSLNDPYFSGTFLGARRVNRTDDAEYERLEMNLQAYAATQGKMREIAAKMPAPVIKKGKKGAKDNMQVAGKKQKSSTKSMAQGSGKAVAALDKKIVVKSANDSLIAKGPSKKPAKSEPVASKKNTVKHGKDNDRKSADKSGKNRHKNT